MREDEYDSKGAYESTVFEKKAFDSGRGGRVAGTIRFSKERLDSAEKKFLTSDIEFDVPILGEMTR